MGSSAVYVNQLIIDIFKKLIRLNLLDSKPANFYQLTNDGVNYNRKMNMKKLKKKINEKQKKKRKIKKNIEKIPKTLRSTEQNLKQGLSLPV